MGTSIRIRQATPDDVAVIAEYNVAMALETEQRELDPAVVHEGARTLLHRPELGTYWVAERAGELVGQLMLTFEWSDWRNGLFWWIQSVYVRPDCRRNGIYRALYGHVEQLARATPGICGIRLYVEQDNERAIMTYRDLGMWPSGHKVFETDWVLGERKRTDAEARRRGDAGKKN